MFSQCRIKAKTRGTDKSDQLTAPDAELASCVRRADSQLTHVIGAAPPH